MTTTGPSRHINWPLFGAALSANFISLIAGGSYSWTSPVLPKLNGAKTPDDNPFGAPITPFEESWIAALLSLGAAVGPFLGGAVVDRIGRKKTLLISAVPMVISHVILAFATAIELYYFSRFFLGLGVGCVYSLMPMYVGEIAEDSNRGSLGCIMSTVCTLGSLFCLGVGPYLSIKAFSLWCIAPPLAFFVVFGVWAPESPYYLVLVKREAAARQALEAIRTSAVEKELEIIKRNIEESQQHRVQIRDLFASKGIVKGVIIGSALMFFQQFSGISAIVSYMESIFNASGSRIPPELAAMAIGVIQVLCTLLTSQLIDRIGRRVLLLTSLVGISLSHTFLGAYFYLQINNHQDIVAQVFWLPILSLIVYTVMFNMGIGPITWAMMGELFPPHFKSIASTFITFICLLSAFLLTVFFPNLAAILGMAQSFWIFALCSAIGVVFVALMVPETKGKSLRDIQTMLEGGTDKMGSQSK